MDDESARKERAEELREEIAELEEPDSEADGERPREGESMREFIERKMREQTKEEESA